jgi:hypothetical protein
MRWKRTRGMNEVGDLHRRTQASLLTLTLLFGVEISWTKNILSIDLLLDLYSCDLNAYILLLVITRIVWDDSSGWLRMIVWASRLIQNSSIKSCKLRRMWCYMLMLRSWIFENPDQDFQKNFAIINLKATSPINRCLFN